MTALLDHLLAPLAQFLDDPAVEEVCIQSPREAFVYARGQFTRHAVDLDPDAIDDIAIVAAAQRRQDITPDRPLLNTDLDGRGRLMAVVHPCVEHGRTSLTIRRGSAEWPTLRELGASGLFDKTATRRPQVRDERLLELYRAGQTEDFLRAAVIAGRTIIGCGEVASGKAQPIDANILTPTGFKKMGDVKAGDFVTCPDGRAAKVIGVYPQGVIQAYRITFSDGRTVECSGDHLWRVWTARSLMEIGKTHATRKVLSWARWENKTLLEIKAWFDQDKVLAKNAAVPVVSPLAIEFPPADLPIEPYALGALLGDGHLSKSVFISTADKHILERVLTGLEDYKAVQVSSYDYQLRLSTAFRTSFVGSIDRERKAHPLSLTKRVGGPGRWHYEITYDGKTDTLGGWAKHLGITRNALQHRIIRKRWPIEQALGFVERVSRDRTFSPLILALRNLGLDGLRSHTKFIPNIYKTASAEQRRALIQGLMDTDGSVGSAEMSGSITTTSERMAGDIREVAWSLGAIAKTTKRQTFFTDTKGTKRSGRASFRVSIVHPEIATFFSLPRKTGKCRNKTGAVRLKIAKIEETGKKHMQCILVDHPDHLYITDNYVVTHNTHFIRACIADIPPEERLITIQDTPELRGLEDHHPNSVQLLYDKDGGGARAIDLVEASLRMRPSRIVLQEIRDGAAAIGFLTALQTGHRGITTIHASHCLAAFDRLRVVIKQTPGGAAVSDADIMDQLHALVDVIVHTTRDGGTFSVDEIWYAAAEQ